MSGVRKLIDPNNARNKNSPQDDEPEVAAAAKQFNMLESTMFKHRTLSLFGEVNQDVARRLVEKLLALSYESDDPITLFISSPGGHVESGDAIYDVIQFIKPVVRVVGTGWVGSIANHIFLAPDLEHRLCLPNTRFLIHQPSGGFGGDATDIEIHAREMLKTRERLNRMISERTGQPLERVADDTGRDYWMSAEESKTYGIVGRIIRTASELG